MSTPLPKVICEHCGGMGYISPDALTTGKLIRHYRTELNMSQLDLSQALEIPCGHVRGIEKDLGDPTLTILRKYANALQINVKDLIL